MFSNNKSINAGFTMFFNNRSTNAGPAAFPLRVFEVAFAGDKISFELLHATILTICKATIAGVLGQYVGAVDFSLLFIAVTYTEALAGMSILLAFLWMFPFRAMSAHYAATTISLTLFFLWVLSFALVHLHMAEYRCDIQMRDRTGFISSHCVRWNVARAFGFLSAMAWLFSFIAVSHTHPALHRYCTEPWKGVMAIRSLRRARVQIPHPRARYERDPTHMRFF